MCMRKNNSCMQTWICEETKNRQERLQVIGQSAFLAETWSDLVNQILSKGSFIALTDSQRMKCGWWCVAELNILWTLRSQLVVCL